MAMKKKTAYKGKRRQYRKRGAKARSGINTSYTAPKNFVETIRFKDVTSAAGSNPESGTAIDLSFRPNQLPILNGALTGIYRQFCIRGVKITYQPAYNTYPLVAGVAYSPRVYFAEDKTAAIPDQSAINLNALLTQDNARTFNPYRSWSTYIKMPKPLLLSTTDAGGDGVPDPTIVQMPSNLPLWLTLQTQSALNDNPGIDVPHLVGRLVAEDNNSAVTITLGRLFYKVYYSVKEQAVESIVTRSGPAQ